VLSQKVEDGRAVMRMLQHVSEPMLRSRWNASIAEWHRKKQKLVTCQSPHLFLYLNTR